MFGGGWVEWSGGEVQALNWKKTVCFDEESSVVDEMKEGSRYKALGGKRYQPALYS
jgi:hypothetical protein